MIRKYCDRCGEYRSPLCQDSIDSLEFEVKKKAKDTQIDSRGNKEPMWRFRICPMNCSLCRKCIDELYRSDYRVCGNWLQEGDYPPEVYDLVQTPLEAKIHRFNHFLEYEAASKGQLVPRLKHRDALLVITSETMDELARPIAWEYGPDRMLYPKK